MPFWQKGVVLTRFVKMTSFLITNRKYRFWADSISATRPPSALRLGAGQVFFIPQNSLGWGFNIGIVIAITFTTESILYLRKSLWR